MSDQHGPWAFPRPDGSVDDSRSGMALRDYFAAKALVGILPTGTSAITAKAGEYAQTAYAIADAMLKERAK